jgi:hypothetical protein
VYSTYSIQWKLEVDLLAFKIITVETEKTLNIDTATIACAVNHLDTMI